MVVSQFSAVRTYVLTDTVECQEPRFVGLTSLINILAIPGQGERSFLLKRGRKAVQPHHSRINTSLLTAKKLIDKFVNRE